MWLSLAKAQGGEFAVGSVTLLGGLDIVKKEMNADQIGEAQELAAEWWEEYND